MAGDSGEPEVKDRAQPYEAVRSFRITTIRRLNDSPGVATAVPDEEVIRVLWLEHAAIEGEIGAALQENPGVATAEVTIEDLRPDHSVLAVVKFVLEATVTAEVALAAVAGPLTIAVATALQNHLGPVESAAVPAAAAASEEEAAASTPWQRVAPVVGAIATGIGVAGFVAFVGGVILSARLTAAGFPAEAALNVVPTQDMLVIGAETLVPSVLWALLTVAVLFVVVTGGRNAYLHFKSQDEVIGEQEQRLRTIAMFLFVLLPLLAATAGSWNSVPRLKAVLFAILAGLLLAAIATATSHLAYLVATTFVTVGAFLTFLAYERALSTPEARGAAVVRQNKTATIGFFIAESADRVYLARVNLHPGTDEVKDRFSRLVGIRKDQISDWSVGGAKKFSDAVAQAKGLARELCELQPRLVVKAGAPKPEKCWTAAPGEPQP